jgi:ABC-2 type transport system permease protein
LKPVRTILVRELSGYFATPIAYVVLAFFLLSSNGLAFGLGALFERGQADMAPFFTFLPWVFMVLGPAVTMRLWAEERRNGTVELLLTQPVTLWQAVLGKFFAAWLFVGIALALTFPLWITLNYLGNPDNGAILAGYIGAFLMAAVYLGLGSLTSALTKNQLIALLLGVWASFMLLLTGYPMVTDWFRSWGPQWLTDGIVSLSVLTHFESITKGVLDLRDVLYFALFTTFFLLASAVVLDARKSK